MILYLSFEDLLVLVVLTETKNKMCFSRSKNR